MAILSGTGNPSSVPESSSGLVVNMNDDPGIYWTPEEQATLEDLLIEYASLSNISRYAKIASELNDKTARDVARRVRWMNERVSDPAAKSSQFSVRPNVPPYAPPMIRTGNPNVPPYMPSLQVKMNEKLANSILPLPRHQPQ